MGGEVAFAIRRNGRQETKELSKHAAGALATASFFDGKGDLHAVWGETPNQSFAPLGYGLVVVDYDNKWAASIQGYTNHGDLYLWRFREKEEARQAKQELCRLVATGRLKGIREFPDLEMPSLPEFDAWYLRLKKMSQKDGVHTLCAKVGPPRGWTFNQYPEDEKGWEEFLVELGRRGWEIASSDVPAWEQFYDDRRLSVTGVRAILAQGVYDEVDAATSPAAARKSAPRL